MRMQEENLAVTGITSARIAELRADIPRLQRETLEAIVDYYGADTDAERDEADERAKLASAKCRSARASLDALQDVQADAQDHRKQIAAWIKAVVI